jgi:hypothetical protein
MAQLDNTKATPEAIKKAENMWENFIKISTICGCFTAAILVLMALFLV